jgi:Ca-activated chloride channel family protein
MKAYLKVYLKLLTPITIAAVVGCVSNQDSKTTVVSTLAEPFIVKEAEFEAKRKHTLNKIQKHLNVQSQLASSPFVSTDNQSPYYQDTDRENYASIEQSAVKQVSSEPVSTFSIDVDTGSYTNIRRMLNQGYLPPVDAVRVEEMINYFDYAYEVPDSQSEPFSIKTEVAQSPWSSNHVLLQVALKGYELVEENRPAANLVFLLDVSGSMNSPHKLPLLKKSLIMLSKQLKSYDKVAIVVYAGASGVVLEPTPGNQSLQIEQALEKLTAGGATNGQSGIQLAYTHAKNEYVPNGINRRAVFNVINHCSRRKNSNRV